MKTKGNGGVPYNGKLFRAFRKSQLRSMAETAMDAGLAEATYRDIERDAPVTITTIKKAIHGLGLTVEQAREKGLIFLGEGKRK
jgi:transcriptional regulator with XRE-family HTH domain